MLQKRTNFSRGLRPRTTNFSPQLCDETHELNFEYLTFNWSVSSVNWWISSIKWWISSLNWWISSLNSWPINATRTPIFFCDEDCYQIGCVNFFSSNYFLSLASSAQSQREFSFNDLFSVWVHAVVFQKHNYVTC